MTRGEVFAYTRWQLLRWAGDETSALRRHGGCKLCLMIWRNLQNRIRR